LVFRGLPPKRPFAFDAVARAPHDRRAELIRQELRDRDVRIQAGDMQAVTAAFDVDLAQILRRHLFQAREDGQRKAHHRRHCSG